MNRGGARRCATMPLSKFREKSMLRSLGLRASSMRLLGIAAAATLMLSAGSAQRAEALTLINPATSPATKAATDDLVTQVRHGGGGHGGGGGHFHGGGIRYGGFRHYGGYHRHWGYRPHFGYRHFHRRYYGGYYPYYHYPRRCRIIWTYYGPRRICRWHHWHRWHNPYRYYW
ncbi:hypothetical protein FBZ96_1011205 [Bradyrhizobium stylosanthis]|uniref:Uncharacterized protein n=2 Tax=Bradyrhizobium stylosanthis TaxID=1803665 RepID=A0A560EDC3_9BRAD|nr:hypothetical protein FBZ96_1011205 [Bradyrhizobium stylosanthis]